jgi:hypothetical protein
MEECGLEVPASLWVPFKTMITDNNRLLIFMKAKIQLGVGCLSAFTPNREVQALVLLEQDTPICFPFHSDVRDEYYKTRKLP